MYDEVTLCSLLSSAHELGSRNGSHEITVGLRRRNPPLGRKSLGRRFRTARAAATVSMFEPNQQLTDAQLAMELGAPDLTTDPEALRSAREAYQRGFDDAIRQTMESFMRSYLSS